MSVWRITFTKQFSISVEAETKEAALEAAENAANNGEMEHDWVVPEEWEVSAFANPVKYAADHALKDGEIVNIQDA